MLNFTRRVEVHICTRPVDMRASFDRLSEMVRSELVKDPLSGHLFVFVNRSRNTCKTLYWDGTGLVIIHKRLETGLFSQFNRLWGSQLQLTAAEFFLFLEGTDLSKRFIESPEEFRFSPRKRVAS
jgi:transposase